MAFVEFRDVRKVYRMGEVEVAAVDGMTFDIERGELVVVVGPSGAGKTTLLNMLGGMDACSSGTIMLDGREISAFSEKELTYYRRYDIGFVFQFYNLVQNLTALENVELASQICKDPLDAASVLKQVGLAHRLDNFPAQLSGGEQQRVAIARALAGGADVVFADEPTGSLDSANGREVLRMLRAIGDDPRRSVVMVTHDLEAASLADRVLVLKDGRIIKELGRTTAPAILEAMEVQR